MESIKSATGAITGISSMATRQLLAELVPAFERTSGQAVALQSVGGVDAARRVQAGEVFDVVLLAADAIDKLVASGAVLAGSRVDFVRSPMAVAAPAGAAAPDISTEDKFKAAVLAAPSVAYSTGPSGNHWLQLLERWGISEAVKPRLLQAPAGVPVAMLLASGQAALGVQQLSELIGHSGVLVLGDLPLGADFITTFAGAVCASSSQPRTASALLQFLAAPHTSAAKKRHGMAPA